MNILRSVSTEKQRKNYIKLSELLEGFTYPNTRWQDIPWLIRNLAIRNSDNPRLNEVIKFMKDEFPLI